MITRLPYTNMLILKTNVFMYWFFYYFFLFCMSFIMLSYPFYVWAITMWHMMNDQDLVVDLLHCEWVQICFIYHSLSLSAVKSCNYFPTNQTHALGQGSVTIWCWYRNAILQHSAILLKKKMLVFVWHWLGPGLQYSSLLNDVFSP